MTFSYLYLCLSDAGIIGLPQVGQILDSCTVTWNLTFFCFFLPCLSNGFLKFSDLMKPCFCPTWHGTGLLLRTNPTGFSPSGSFFEGGIECFGCDWVCWGRMAWSLVSASLFLAIKKVVFLDPRPLPLPLGSWVGHACGTQAWEEGREAYDVPRTTFPQ